MMKFESFEAYANFTATFIDKMEGARQSDERHKNNARCKSGDVEWGALQFHIKSFTGAEVGMDTLKQCAEEYF